MKAMNSRNGRAWVPASSSSRGSYFGSQNGGSHRSASIISAMETVVVNSAALLSPIVYQERFEALTYVARICDERVGFERIRRRGHKDGVVLRWLGSLEHHERGLGFRTFGEE